MKTLKDLREAIIKNEGSLAIGQLRFIHNAGQDVDVHLGSRLVFWISSQDKDEDLLENLRGTISSDVEGLDHKSDFEQEYLCKFIDNTEQFFKRIRQNTIEEELRTDLADVKKQLAEKEKLVKNSELALGKVEAYEKLLIGRGVTISA
jgi:hypothetical protein